MSDIFPKDTVSNFVLPGRILSINSKSILSNACVNRKKGRVCWFISLYEWDIQLLYKETLEREDKNTMAHSIEMREPFLDF